MPWGHDHWYSRLATGMAGETMRVMTELKALAIYPSVSGIKNNQNFVLLTFVGNLLEGPAYHL